MSTQRSIDRHLLFGMTAGLLLVAVGFWAGDFVRRRPVGVAVVRRLVVVGAGAALAGAAWHPLFPINKRLWTSSYVLFTGGCALVLLAATYWLVEVRGLRAFGRPFEVMGLNAILAYMASEELANVLATTHAKPWLYTHVFAPYAGDLVGSLLFSLTLAAALWVFLVPLYRRRLFLRV